MNISKVINWLRSVEYLAGNVYLEASNQFAADQDFSAFLSRLHKDEEWHASLLGEALLAIKEKESLPKFGIKIDSAIKEKIESPFKELYYLIKKGTLTKNELVNYIIKAEFSEWNSIFLYTMKLVGDFTADFQYTSAATEAHKEKIQSYLESLAEEITIPSSLDELSKIWDKKIFIVDEDASFRDFLSDLLKSMGHAEIAFNGQEGLNKIKENFYDVILTEVNMERKSGIDFYKESIELNPHLSRNFLFYSYEISPDSKKFIRDNSLPFLEKPLSIRKLTSLVQHTMDKTF